jgi:hypothetical protein
MVSMPAVGIVIHPAGSPTPALSLPAFTQRTHSARAVTFAWVLRTR